MNINGITIFDVAEHARRPVLDGEGRFARGDPGRETCNEHITGLKPHSILITCNTNMCIPLCIIHNL